MAKRKVVPFDEFYYQLKLKKALISETPCIQAVPELSPQRKKGVFG
jgi:hypothetical protein